ncbi:cell division protein ZapC [Photobacterium angustum]|uniref:Cell division protein ZapC n=1 Tax=Photobacterium angustum TaxID=661 RepID=A0A855SHS1_PHOAN|nr:cell division protein ZapC [Photobacterium angustum]KJF80902.1 cell division protein ZapC [Photobacterium damselae subsp. damselae]KJG00178.1 cell division protein ZapC [Photobacterium angustum]KJG19166.1 cell division protein ZapC [Photobacterium angustum]KJG25141.1 cell division protein ZapC [Photobacterium angustum]KJG27496.1 cell division protein ZapC [Photobacterium angustum]
MLKPDNSWKWYFDAEMNSLMLELNDDMLFRVSLPSKLLTPEAKISDIFNVDDIEAYQNFQEQIAHLPISAARKCELALNATAARRFHKPMMPKSWYFVPQQGVEPLQGQVITLMTASCNAHYVVIENSGVASLCMLADVATVDLDGVKSMEFCETIKVMNDRMSPCSVENEQRHFALVG